MASDTNVVCLVARLTRDPDYKTTASGVGILNMRLAFTTRRKRGETWEDEPNYVSCSVIGRQADSLAKNLVKGRRVAVTGSLEWREWEKGGEKRSEVSVLAENVQYLDSRDDSPAPRGASVPTRVDDDSTIPFAPSVA